MVGLIMAIHLSIPIMHNVGGFFQSLAIVKKNKERNDMHVLAERIQMFNERAPLSAYGRYTGVATGYGFFAPQVASPFMLQVVVNLEGHHRCDTIMAPPRLRRGEAVRYRAFTTSMRNLLPETWKHYGTDPLAVRYTQVLARHTAQQWAADLGGEMVSFSVIAVHLPTLRHPVHQFIDIYSGS